MKILKINYANECNGKYHLVVNTGPRIIYSNFSYYSSHRVLTNVQSLKTILLKGNSRNIRLFKYMRLT